MGFPRRGRKENIMDRQKELAEKVVKLAKDFTGWNFSMEQDGDSCYVITTVTDLARKNRITIYYTIREQYALLTVFCPYKGYNEALVGMEVNMLPYKNEIFYKYGVFATTFRETGIYFNSPFPLDVLENETSSIVGAVTADLLGAVMDVINYGNRNYN